MLLQPLVFLLQPPKAAPVVPPAPASCGRLCCRGGVTTPILLPPLARPSLHSPTPPFILRRRQPHTAAEPVNPRTPLRVGYQMMRLPRLHVIPFLGLAVVQTTALVLSAWCGQRGQGTASIGRGLYVERLTAGSTAAARKCLLITRKIMIPPPDS